MRRVEFHRLGEPEPAVNDPLGTTSQVRPAKICDEVLPGDEP